MTDEVVPVEVGQWRIGKGLTVFAVLRPHPRRKGFWMAVSSEFPYRVDSWGRKELEAMPVVTNRDYFGADRGHPGERYVKTLEEAFKA